MGIGADGGVEVSIEMLEIMSVGASLLFET